MKFDSISDCNSKKPVTTLIGTCSVTILVWENITDYKLDFYCKEADSVYMESRWPQIRLWLEKKLDLSVKV